MIKERIDIENIDGQLFEIKVVDPEQQCTLDSWKGQDVGIAYKIENKSGDYIWRRMIGKLTAVTGGLISGYELTFNADNPGDEEKPLFMNFGTADSTTMAMDAMTDFGSYFTNPFKHNQKWHLKQN